ncbi:hypothetical protein BFL36_11350 [Clavibacter michiganensis]|uniref:Uncharacterized protein n=1 Tax=Clavibacter michiganensis TaxID=28447 RepID=A0A251Y9V1_9MICO|nr:hypothetical protein [Clavibacter michiganensis]OUE21012.1 hypothetical protein BFL36_11350 [Clavibacter michiganensis]
MTADDPRAEAPAARDDTTPADPGHGRRALARIGARAIAAWIAEVVTPRRRIVALGVALLAGVATGLLIHPVLARADGPATALPGAIVLGAVVGAAVGTIPASIWLTRAIRRHPSVVGTHPAWRDAALLDGAVDARGRVSLAPGTAERVATESRRVIASSSVPVPGALVLSVVALVGIPAYALSGEPGTLVWFAPVYLLMSATTLGTQSVAAGRIALLRDAADAELALPEHERTVAPHVAPPHGSRLP